MVRMVLLLVLMFNTSYLCAQPETPKPKPPEVQQVDHFDFIPVVWDADWSHTKNWALVVDTSHSIFGRITGVRQDRFRKMLFALAQFSGNDHMNFCTVAFNDQSPIRMVPYLGWKPTSPDTLKRMERWCNLIDNRGTMSYGGNAIRRALRQQTKDLTVIIISDGGFTEKIAKIRKIIKEEQKARVKNGWGEAVICTIGIENHLPPDYPKPSDEVCQSWMQEIGTTGKGGYFYVKRRE